MAEHKVPQDVEAEDKLLGPFSFRQFLYLLVALGAGALAYFIGTVAIPLALIPLPIAILFLVLALPLRKDQPMETYLAAMIHFYFAPNRRVWDADGQEALIEITNPRIDDGPQVKDIGGAEAAQRLSFLAEVSDTQGWSTRGILGVPSNTTNLSDDFATAAVDAPDILDDAGTLGRDFDDRLASSEQRRRAEMMAKMANDVPLTPQPAQSYVHEYQSPMTPVNQPVSAPQPAPIPEVDEAALAAALRQSSQASQLSYRQPTVQPLNTVAAVPVQPAQPAQAIQPAPVPAPTPTPVLQPAPQTVSTPAPIVQMLAETPTAPAPVETKPEPKPELITPTEPISPVTDQPEPATIEDVSAIESTDSVFTSPPSRAESEAVIDHEVDTGGDEIEVKLH